MDVQRIEPGTRRRAIWIVVLVAAVGTVLLLWFERSLPELHAWLTERPDRTVARAKLLLAVIGTLVILPLGGFAVYLWFLGQRISSARRYPLPLMKLVRDTAVVSGPAAEKRSRLVKAMAVLLATCALGLFGILCWLANRLATSLP